MTQRHAAPLEVRRLALQALYQLDARGEADAPAVRAALDPDGAFEPRDADNAMRAAVDAFRSRAQADRAVRDLAPEWPPHRQPAIDRAILRLGWHELAEARLPVNVVISACVDLAKEFSTERSPAFVNAVLDRVAKRLAAERAAASAPPADSDPGPDPAPDAGAPAPAAEEAAG